MWLKKPVKYTYIIKILQILQNRVGYVDKGPIVSEMGKKWKDSLLIEVRFSSRFLAVLRPKILPLSPYSATTASS